MKKARQINNLKEIHKGVKMKLSERREKWENGLEPLLSIYDAENARAIVVLKGKDIYYLHRYFPIGIECRDWEISVDWSGSNLEDGLKALSEQYESQIQHLMV